MAPFTLGIIGFISDKYTCQIHSIGYPSSFIISLRTLNLCSRSKGRYWCDEKVGYWAREEKEMCPGGATCLPLLGNVLTPLGQRACPKTGQKTL